MDNVGKGTPMTFLIGCLLGLILGFVGTTLRMRTQPQPITIMTPQPTATAEPTATPGPIHVYVNGAVQVADVFSLPAGSLVGDAIDAAGGFLAEAEARGINLAQPLVDGMHIYVPTVEEVAEDDLPPVRGVSVPIIAPEAPAPIEAGAGGAPGTTAGGLLNINTASAAELEELPGIGPSLAQRIVDHRNSNGLFTTIEEIQDVSGIGPAKYEAIKELITVE